MRISFLSTTIATALAASALQVPHASAQTAATTTAPAAARGVPLNDGRTFEGWEGDTKNTWRIEDGAFTAGNVERKQERNDFLCTVKEYANFDLTLKWKLTGTEGFVNGGVQFRTKRIPNHFEVSGYQADLGAGYDGTLYDESRRNKILMQPPKDVLEKARKPLGEWNDYRIRAEGRRIQIWLNGVQTVDYTEAEDGIAPSGIIAVQIHGNAKSQVWYKDLVIEELPASPAAASKPEEKPAPPAPAPEPAKGAAIPPTTPVGRIAENLPAARKLAPFKDGKFSIEKDEVIVFVGSENMVLEQRQGDIEAELTTRFKEQNPRFRHMSWEGDTVFRQNRMMEWGSWPSNLEAAGATMVVAWFGQVEALDSTKTVADFEKSYGLLLDEFAKTTPRIVLIGPPLFEESQTRFSPDNTGLNDRVHEIITTIRKLATARGLVFVDFTELIDSKTYKTRDGMHLLPSGNSDAARLLQKQLGLSSPAYDPAINHRDLKAAIVEKNRLWFDTWRCMNWAFAYGDRTTQPFAKGTDGRPPFVEELRKYQPLLAHWDATIRAALGTGPAVAPLPPETPRADPPALSAEEQRKRMKVREGFEVQLFADESLGVVRPIQIRWDERGRLWVACTPSYPQLQPGEHGNDYILVLEDTDGDGRADKTTRFAEHLTMPMGFEFAPRSVGGGLYVCESTQLIHLRDSNQDDKADNPGDVLLSGFGTGDTHQNANSLRWGPDGCLWFTQGYHIWSYVETPYGLAELNRSGIWRFNPRTLKLDSFLNESSAGLNCWGTAWDDYGQMFHGSGADTPIWYTTPAMIPTLHPQPLPTAMCLSRGKSMEPEFLGSSHLPPELQGVLLKSTYFTSQVQLYRLRDEGSGFASEDLGDLLSGENEFRPVESRVGPDGAIYVCDWLNPVIGHYQASYRDPRRDRSHGRIWRVTAKDRALVQRPASCTDEDTPSATIFDSTHGGAFTPRKEASIAKLFAQLRSPERWARDAAKFALYRRLPGAVISPLQEATKQAIAAARLNPADEAPQRLLYELSGIYAAHEQRCPEIIEQLLTSKDFRYRAWAVRLIGIGAGNPEDAPGLLTGAIADAHPRVRLEAVIACASLPADAEGTAVKIATLAMLKPMDAPLDYALTQCIHALAPGWKAALAKGKLELNVRPDALVRILTTAGDADSSKIIRELYQEVDRKDFLNPPKGPGPTTREKLLATLITFGTPQDAEFAAAKAPDSEHVMTALVNACTRAPKVDRTELLADLLSASEPPASTAACRIVAATGKDWGTIGRINTLMKNDIADTAARIAAMHAIARVQGKNALTEIMSFHNDPALPEVTPGENRSYEAHFQKITLLANGAVAAAAPLDPDSVAASVVDTLVASTDKNTDKVAPRLAPFFAIKGGSASLAKAASQLIAQHPDRPGRSAEHILGAKLALRWMSETGHDDDDLRTALSQIAGTATNTIPDYSEAFVKQIATDAAAKGDAKSGAAIFASAQSTCLACHKVGNDGGTLGPDLTAIGRAMTHEAIVESVLWPKRQVKEGYLLTLITTKDGQTLQGYKASEDTTAVTLKDLAGNPTAPILKSNIATRTDTGTLMPDGIVTPMNPQQRLDLLKYLFELGK